MKSCVSCSLKSTGTEGGGELATYWLGTSYPLSGADYSVSCGWSWKLTELQHYSTLLGWAKLSRLGGWVRKAENKANLNLAGAGIWLSLATKWCSETNEFMFILTWNGIESHEETSSCPGRPMTHPDWSWQAPNLLRGLQLSQVDN